MVTVEKQGSVLAKSVQCVGYELDNRDSIPSRVRDFFISANSRLVLLLNQPNGHLQLYRQGYCSQGEKLISSHNTERE
jgi:hypothetical protein